ncbi:MAG: ATP synthase F1 subunit gamma [Candidatus Marinimicrobia bacterium]|nr:ATP synthase F1 subunit gamma [Candidatus Neomarinimicrobiota bacterium]
MANLKNIRERIASVKSIQQVTRAMKLVAAAKLRRAQINMSQARPYAHRLRDMLHNLLPQIDRAALEVLQLRPKVERTLLLVVTSDRGMAAGFNINVIKLAEARIQELGKDQVDLICVGRKGRDHFQRRGYEIVSSHVEFWSDLRFHHATTLGAEIVSRYTSGSVDQVLVFFNEFVNVIKQDIRQEQLLPLVVDEGADIDTSDVLFEPSREEVVASLVPRHLNVQIWRYLLESYAAEQAARMTAMENATTNAKDVIRALELSYNKARQAAITSEILDIVGGAEALKEAS